MVGGYDNWLISLDGRWGAGCTGSSPLWLILIRISQSGLLPIDAACEVFPPPCPRDLAPVSVPDPVDPMHTTCMSADF